MIDFSLLSIYFCAGSMRLKDHVDSAHLRNIDYGQALAAIG